VVDALAPRVSNDTGLIDPLTDPRWAELARDHGSLFSSPPWLGALHSTYGFEIEAWLGVDDEGSPTGGIPFARLRGNHGGRLSSLPFSDYCDPIVTSGSSWAATAERLFGEDLPVEIRCLHQTAAMEDPRFGPGEADRWHAIDLDHDEDRAWDALAGSARRAIRKARDSDIEIRASNDLESLRSFYDLHLQVRKHKYRLLAQPFDFFLSLDEAFGDQMVLMGAWQGESLVAGNIYLTWGDTLYYKFNASSGADLGARPNDLLMWEGMRYAVARGLRSVDLGRTDSDHQSLARFKEKYATRDGLITVLRDREFRKDAELMAILGPLTELLTLPGVPDDVTEAAGALIYRHFA
jgi:CelD/BcsL family acetyltransferase involved in cellulose biosynthesis